MIFINNFMSTFLKIVVAIIVVLIVLGVLRTWQLERSANQKVFAGGTVPNPLPNGLYNGTVPGHTVSWLGKKFFATGESASGGDASEGTGINVFTPLDMKLSNGVTTTEKYPFKTYIGKGAHDGALDVIKIDYNIAGNPLWLRPILDEIVEISPGHYLGKLQLRIIPGYPFTLTYFELTK